MFIANKLGPKLVELLGLPNKTRSFTLHMEANQPASISCEYFPEQGQVDEVIKLLHKEYTLQPKLQEVTCLTSESTEWQA